MEKTKQFIRTHKSDIARVLVGSGVIFISFWAGAAYGSVSYKRAYDRGMAAVLLAKPELKEQLLDALDSVEKTLSMP